MSTARQCKRFRICAKGREITNSQGIKKNLWLELGQISVFSDQPLPEAVSFSVELNTMPNQQINAFPIEKKQFQNNAGPVQNDGPLDNSGVNW